MQTVFEDFTWFKTIIRYYSFVCTALVGGFHSFFIRLSFRCGLDFISFYKFPQYFVFCFSSVIRCCFSSYIEFLRVLYQCSLLLMYSFPVIIRSLFWVSLGCFLTGDIHVLSKKSSMNDVVIHVSKTVTIPLKMCQITRWKILGVLSKPKWNLTYYLWWTN